MSWDWPRATSCSATPRPEAKGSASADFALIARLNGPASVKISRDGAEKETASGP